ncbi:MAG: PepSY-associated TM helix domain-containing protein, partial [Caulobacteraceae bacterium]|nr:PepSY-associated TM helix domain-containing protein [Caulobacter sp.]
PDRALAAAAGRGLKLLGAYKDGSVDGDQHLIRLEGARGATDLTVDSRTGAVDAAIQPASAVNVIEELHRGRAAGPAWRWVIDVSAVVILLLSLVGYVLFFSLRFRLRTSLLLTGASLLAMAAIYVLAVP